MLSMICCVKTKLILARLGLQPPVIAGAIGFATPGRYRRDWVCNHGHSWRDWVCLSLPEVRPRPPPLQTLHRRLCLTLRFKSSHCARINTKKVRLNNLAFLHFGQTGFEPATPSPPDLYAKPLRHCPLLHPWTNISEHST